MPISAHTPLGQNDLRVLRLTFFGEHERLDDFLEEAWPGLDKKQQQTRLTTLRPFLLAKMRHLLENPSDWRGLPGEERELLGTIATMFEGQTLRDLILYFYHWKGAQSNPSTWKGIANLQIVVPADEEDPMDALGEPGLEDDEPPSPLLPHQTSRTKDGLRPQGVCATPSAQGNQPQVVTRRVPIPSRVENRGEAPTTEVPPIYDPTPRPPIQPRSKVRWVGPPEGTVGFHNPNHIRTLKAALLHKEPTFSLGPLSMRLHMPKGEVQAHFTGAMLTLIDIFGNVIEDGKIVADLTRKLLESLFAACGERTLREFIEALLREKGDNVEIRFELSDCDFSLADFGPME